MRSLPLTLKLIGLSLSLALTLWGLHTLATKLMPGLPYPIGERSEVLLEGVQTTIWLTVWGSLIGIVSGAILAAASKGPFYFYYPASLIVGLLRGTPLLVQILFCYFALPVLLPELGLDEFKSACLALGLNMGAYNSEVFRAGLDTIAKGQWEASWSLGLTNIQTLYLVVLPQTFKVVLPPLLNNLIALLKDSSLASAIGLLELSMAGQRISSESFEPVSTLTTVATMYLTLTFCLTILIKIFRLEDRTGRLA